jgi:hypothetical protein
MTTLLTHLSITLHSYFQKRHNKYEQGFLFHDRFLLFVCSFVIRLEFVHTRDGEYYEWEGVYSLSSFVVLPTDNTLG